MPVITAFDIISLSGVNVLSSGNRLQVGADSTLMRSDSGSFSASLFYYNNRTGTNETLSLADFNGVSMNNGNPSILNVPLNSSVPFPVGLPISILQLGTGQVTISPITGSVTVNSRGAAYKMAGQHASAVLTKIGTNTWNFAGDITT